MLLRWVGEETASSRAFQGDISTEGRLKEGKIRQSLLITSSKCSHSPLCCVCLLLSLCYSTFHSASFGFPPQQFLCVVADKALQVYNVMK